MLTEFFSDYGLFLAKVVTLLAAVMAGAAVLVSIRQREATAQERLHIRKLNARYEAMQRKLEGALLDKRSLRQTRRQRKRAERQRRRAAKGALKGTAAEPTKARLYVLSFQGDVRASAVDNLREEITAILQVARKQDEVVLRLESGGGMVHTYGLAASQLRRLRDAGLTLTVTVDRVAASGGYMMACVGHRIVAAPFAILGSIGVVGQMPNLHRWLKRRDIDYELHTAGQYKRTLTLLGENSDEGRAKFKEELEQTHELFKAFIREHRPRVDLTQVATGEYWYGTQALELKLADELKTSDDYLLSHKDKADIYEISFKRRSPFGHRLGGVAGDLIDELLARAWHKTRADSVHRG